MCPWVWNRPWSPPGPVASPTGLGPGPGVDPGLALRPGVCRENRVDGRCKERHKATPSPGREGLPADHDPTAGCPHLTPGIFSLGPPETLLLGRRWEVPRFLPSNHPELTPFLAAAGEAAPQALAAWTTSNPSRLHPAGPAGRAPGPGARPPGLPRLHTLPRRSCRTARLSGRREGRLADCTCAARTPGTGSPDAHTRTPRDEGLPPCSPRGANQEVPGLRRVVPTSLGGCEWDQARDRVHPNPTGLGEGIRNKYL